MTSWGRGHPQRQLQKRVCTQIPGLPQTPPNFFSLQALLKDPGFPPSRKTSILKRISQKNLFASKISPFFTKTESQGPGELGSRQPGEQGIRSDLPSPITANTHSSLGGSGLRWATVGRSGSTQGRTRPGRGTGRLQGWAPTQAASLVSLSE